MTSILGEECILDYLYYISFDSTTMFCSFAGKLCSMSIVVRYRLVVIDDFPERFEKRCEYHKAVLDCVDEVCTRQGLRSHERQK